MARLVTSGFEVFVDAQSLGTGIGPDGVNASGGSRDTSLKRSGLSSLRFASASLASNDFALASVLDRGYWIRIYLFITTLPSAAHQILANAGANSTVQLATTGRVFSSINTGATSAALNDGAWHRIEYFFKQSATQAARAWELRVDDLTVASGTGQTGDSSVFTSVRVQSSSSAVLNFDDLAINDDQGAAQNSWPGDGRVVLLVPTADSAVGAGWTLGTGTAISGNAGAGAVDNTPPSGVADLTAGSDTKQIRNATANANSNYDATMATYTAAGIGAPDTINVLVPWVYTAAPVATSAKLGTVGVVSNPAIANINLGTLGTSGAFWQGNAAGTYPNGWKWSSGTVTYNPSVTTGTAPVVRITQVTASTRIAMVSFVGIYVDYTPAAAATAKPSRATRIPSVAVMRAALR